MRRLRKYCETTKSLKNDRLYVPTASKKRDINATRLLKTRSNFSKYLMLSVAVSSLSASNIHVLESGVKINGTYYRDVVLGQMLLPDIGAASRSKFFVFQQDSVPSHRAKDTVALLDQETPDFTPPALWPPNSPDLNSVDYTVWSVLQERVYRAKISDVGDLKRRINSEWAALSHAVIERAVGEWCQRLRPCVCAGGGHFEHVL